MMVMVLVIVVEIGAQAVQTFKWRPCASLP